MDDNIQFQLGENPTLLNLYGYDIDAEAAAEIARALAQNTITTVYLSDNEISDEGAAAIAGALEHDSTIITLNLGGNEIGAEGAAAIAGALEHNTTITTVDLGGNEIGDEGAAAIARALEHNSTITYVDLDSNDIGDEGAAEISILVKRNRIARAMPILRSRRAVREGQESPSIFASRMAKLPRQIFNSVLFSAFGVYPRDTRQMPKRVILEDVAAPKKKRSVATGAGGRN